MSFVYKMIQLPPNIIVGQKQTGSEAAVYLEGVVNQHARDGWEFFRIDSFGVHTQPGCFSRARFQSYYVATFRKEA